MAGGIKGITVKIGGDTTELGKAITKTNVQARSLQKELKGVNTLLKYDPKNVTLLKQKQDLLTKSIKDTEDKLKVLKEAQDQITPEMIEQDEEGYRDLQREIASTEQKLKKLQKEQYDFGSVGAQQVKAVGEKMQEVGEKVEAVGKSFSKLSAVSGAILGGSVASFNSLKEGYDSIAKGTGATGTQLEKLKDIAGDVYGSMATDMDTVGSGLADINTRFGFTGKTLETATEDFIKFADVNNTDVSTAIANVSRYMGDAGIESSQYAEVLDTLTKASQNSGISVDQLSESLTKYGAPMRALGFETQESIAIFSQWEKAGVNTEIAFSGMKTAISSWSADGKDAREEFKKTLTEIKNCPDIASATTKAIEVFGKKAGPDLADAIQGGRFEYEDFLSIIEDSQGTLSDTYEATQDSTDKAKIAFNNLKLAGADLGSSVLTSLAPLIDKVSETIKNLTDKFNGLSPGMKQAIVVGLGIITALGPVLIFVGKLISSVGTVLTLAPKIVSSFRMIGNGFKAFGALASANPVGLIVIALLGLVGALTFAYKHSEKFRNIVNSAFARVKEVVGGVVGALVNFFTATIPNAINVMISFFGGIGSAISSAFSGLVSIVTTIFKAIKTVITLYVKAWKLIITTYINAILLVVKTVFNAVKTVITTVFKAIKSVTSSVWNAIKTAITTPINAVKKTVTTVVNGIKTTVTSAWNALSKTTSTVWNTIKNAITKPITDAKKKVVNTINTIKDKVRGIFDGIKPKLNLSLPKVSVSGGKAPWGIGGKGTLPSFNVKWNKLGAIFNAPTIFGTRLGFQGVGEAGPEAVAPISTLMKYVQTAVNISNEELNYKLVAIESIINTYLPAIAEGHVIVLDSGAVVGGTINQIDSGLYENNTKSTRGW